MLKLWFLLTVAAPYKGLLTKTMQTRPLIYSSKLTRPNIPKGSLFAKGSRRTHGMLHMMFKLGQCAEENWRKLRGFNYLAKVIAGVTFNDGIEATQENQIAA